MSEPERPSVVVSPRALSRDEAGDDREDAAREERLSRRLTRGSLFFRSHVAAPWLRPSRASARVHGPAGTRAASSAAARSGAERRSPKEATRSVTRAVRSRRSATPSRAAESSRERRASKRTPSARAAASCRARRASTAARAARAPPLGLAGGPEEQVRDAAHRRGDGDDTALAARGREEARGAADALRVPERRPAELVDGDLSWLGARAYRPDCRGRIREALMISRPPSASRSPPPRRLRRRRIDALLLACRRPPGAPPRRRLRVPSRGNPGLPPKARASAAVVRLPRHEDRRSVPPARGARRARDARLDRGAEQG